MATGERKRRERAVRERHLSRLALWLAEREGAGALTHARLAEVSEFSKGTVYNHFATVEDLVLELSIENVARQVALLEKIHAWPDAALVKVYAAIFAYQHHALTNRALFDFAVAARRRSAVQAAAVGRVERRREVETRLAGLAMRLADDARLAGDFSQSHLEFEQSIDALRTWLVGYGSILFDRDFNWEASSRSRVETTSRVLVAFGWAEIDSEALAKLDHRVAGLVAEVNGEFSYRSEAPPQWAPDFGDVIPTAG